MPLPRRCLGYGLESLHSYYKVISVKNNKYFVQRSGEKIVFDKSKSKTKIPPSDKCSKVVNYEHWKYCVVD